VYITMSYATNTLIYKSWGTNSGTGTNVTRGSTTSSVWSRFVPYTSLTSFYCMDLSTGAVFSTTSTSAS